MLAELGIAVAGHVIEIGGVQAKETTYRSIEELKSITEASPVRCLDEEAGNQMIKAIDDAKSNGDSIGGIVEVIVEGMPIGVGSYVHYDRKLDAKLAAAMMSINAFKGVEIELVLKQRIDRAAKFMMKLCGMKSMDIQEEQITRVA